MNAKFYKTMFFVTLLVMATQLVFAAISAGIVDERSKERKYSLNNLDRFSHKYVPLRAIKSNLTFSGSTIIDEKNNGNGSVVNELIRFQNGNSTYTIPYSFKVKVNKVAIKFKTPARPEN